MATNNILALVLRSYGAFAKGDRDFFPLRAIIHENEVVITYERLHDDGSRGRNTEIHTILNGKIKRTEVYWGWNIEK